MATPAGATPATATSARSRARPPVVHPGVIELEPIQPQELAITLLGAFARGQEQALWSGGLVRLLADFGVSTPASRAVLARLVRRELLAPQRSGRLVFYEPTERCEELLDEGAGRIFSLGSTAGWDGSWTVAWHSIPSRMRVERGRFGRRLRFFGFGSVQDGTWLSPHNREAVVRAIVDELDISDHVDVLVGRPASGLRIDRLIERGWDLEALSGRYEGFVAAFGAYRDGAGDELDPRGAFLVRTSLVHAYRQFPFMDPDLPDELMPNSAVRKTAVETFHDVYERLGSPAQRHFDAVTAAPRA